MRATLTAGLCALAAATALIVLSTPSTASTMTPTKRTITPAAQQALDTLPPALRAEALSHAQSTIVTEADLKNPSPWLAQKIAAEPQLQKFAASVAGRQGEAGGCTVTPYRMTRYRFRAVGDAKMSCGWGATWSFLLVRLEARFEKPNLHWVLMRVGKASFGGRFRTIYAGAKSYCSDVWHRYWWDDRGFGEASISSVTIVYIRDLERRIWCRP